MRFYIDVAKSHVKNLIKSTLTCVSCRSTYTLDDDDDDISSNSKKKREKVTYKGVKYASTKVNDVIMVKNMVQNDI